MSAYKIETWLKKGFSEREALYQIKIRRPTNVEYFMHKFGVDHDTALIMRDKRQKTLSDKSHTNKTKDEYKQNSPRCVEYWISRGATVIEAQERVSSVQATFSKRKCIEQYGKERGLEVWSNRQKKWQKTLQEKSIEEKDDINAKKNTMDINNYQNKYGKTAGRLKFIEALKKRNCKVLTTLDEMEEYLKSQHSFYYSKLPAAYFISKTIKPYMRQLVGLPKDLTSWVSSFLTFTNNKQIFLKKFGKRQHLCCLLSDGKLLRSSREIFLYEGFLEKGLQYGIDFFVDGVYNNDTKMRYDFFIPSKNQYIEVCGMMNIETYKQKMLFKRDTFNAILLVDTDQDINFLESI